MSTSQPDRGPVWARFSDDPRRKETASIRASDRDRDVVLEILGDAYADGRLDREEYDARSEKTRSAKLLGDIPPLVADLVPTTHVSPDSLALASPADLESRAREAWKRELREATMGLVGAGGITSAIWAVTAIASGGFYFFWPIFVLLATGINVIRTFVQRDDIIARKRTRLERKQRKELGGSES